MSQNEEVPIPMEEDLTPLSLADESGDSGPISGQSSTKIQAFGSHAAGVAAQQRRYKRTPNLTGAGAVRCRLFHSKVTVAALDYMIEQINEWLDENEIDVKYVSQVVGTMEGKSPEPNVIVTVWY